MADRTAPTAAACWRRLQLSRHRPNRHPSPELPEADAHAPITDSDGPVGSPWRCTTATTSGIPGTGEGAPAGPPAITEPAEADTYSAAPHGDPAPVGWNWVAVRTMSRTGSPLSSRNAATSSAGSPPSPTDHSNRDDSR